MKVISLVLLSIVAFVILYLLSRYIRTSRKIQIIHFHDGPSYYKCPDLDNNKATANALDTNNYKRTENNQEWDLYIPCGYTNVEVELLDFNKNLKQKIANDTGKTTQKSIFAVSGCDKLASKDQLWSTLNEKYGRQIAKSLMPETYLTANPNDMALFKLSHASDPESIYILKKNIQDKKGLLILTDMQDILETAYRQDYKIIQHYLKNPLLINNHKVNLRVYVLAKCDPKEGKHIYLYTNGKCLYTNSEYNHTISHETILNDTNHLEANITSVNLDPQIYENLPELMIPDLRVFLTVAKYDVIWLRIVEKMKMVSKALIGELCMNESTMGYNNFQLFGADVIIDEQLDPFILEFNKGPSMVYKTGKDQLLKERLFKDVFCLANVGKCFDDDDSNLDAKTNVKIKNKWVKLV
jgi:hypothetical protein